MSDFPRAQCCLGSAIFLWGRLGNTLVRCATRLIAVRTYIRVSVGKIVRWPCLRRIVGVIDYARSPACALSLSLLCRERSPRENPPSVSHVHCGASFKTSSHPRGGGPIGRREPRPRDPGRPIGATGFEILWSLFTGLLVSTQRCLSSVKGDPCRCTFIHGRCAENRATRS